jgi:LuxR family maltose regulon positive regulatory protein
VSARPPRSWCARKLGFLVSSQLIATKLSVPAKPRRGLARPRLVERLERGAEARLTLVSAPAGFGKTTLIAEWLADSSAVDRSVAWLSLDPTDNEPVTFWTYVVTALHRALPGVELTALELIASPSVAFRSVLSALLNELALAPGDVWLILDDYHLVDDHGIHDEMTYLLEHLPAQVHLVLLTRADPDLPLARWRMRGELVEIRAADLRFTPDEAGAYLTAVPGVELDATDVAVLAERTEGWIAALQLASLSLQGREDVSGFVSQFAGDDRYIVDYLVDEVLRHQPDTVREFLLQSAVLDRLTGPLCDAVTGHGGGTDTLAALERANLFTVALDDRREWYRYHRLFADVLRARLLSERPEQVPVLHRRASRWYESQGLTGEAIGHALTGQDFDRAVHLMELAMPAIRRNRHDATMYGWLEALPDDTVRRSPVLSVFYGSMSMVSGDLDAAESRLGDAEHALAAVADGQIPGGADTDELRTLPSTIAVYRASLAYARSDAVSTTEHARRALTLAGPHDHLARGGATGFLGLAAWSEGDAAAALASFTDSVASLTAAGHHVDELTSTAMLADVWLVAGRPGRARQLYERALSRALTWGAPVARAAAELQVGLSELDIEAGVLEAATTHLHSAAAADDRAGMTEHRSRWFVARALLARARGELREAVELLAQAGRLHRPSFAPDVRPIRALEARVWITQGQLSEAAGWASAAEVTVTDDFSYLREFEHLTLVRLLLAQHRASSAPGAVDQALQILGRLLQPARTGGRLGSVLEIRLLQALAHDARGDRPRAIDTLSDALARADEPDGYVQLFLNEGAPLTSLLRDMQHQGAGQHHPERLLAATHRHRPEPFRSPQQLLGASADSLSQRELQVLKLLDSDLTVPEIARTLYVSHNTVRTHTKHIFTKLEVTSRRAAVHRGREHGLI